MTRIMVIGDIHVSDHAPANCTESYTDDIIAILRWTADYCAATGINTAVWAGDIFHHKAPTKNSHALVLKMIQVVKYYLEKNVELWIVPGNHDMTNDRHESVHTKQPLGVLYAAGAKELNGWHPGGLPLYGVPWQQDWTTDTDRALDGAFGYWNDHVDKTGRPDSWRDNALVVTHAPIYPPAMVERGVPFDLVPTAEIAEEMGHHGYLYYGHIHEDHGIFEDGGVIFANLGAISRGSLHEYNLERTVKVAVWADRGAYGDNEEVGAWSHEEGFNEVVVPQKPASEVFKIDEAALVKSQKMDLDQFLTRVGSSSLDISSVASVIAHIKNLDDVPEPVVHRAIEFLEAVDA